MLRYSYPSKEFPTWRMVSVWREIIVDGREFRVDARLGRVMKRSVRHHIDAVFDHPGRRRRFGSLAAAWFGGDLMLCIAAVSLSGKYDAECSEAGTGLLITFRILESPRENRLRSEFQEFWGDAETG
jgi:hypothetical protein